MPTKKKQPKRADWLTDEQVEEEIARLKSDEYVKLAKEEERIRAQWTKEVSRVLEKRFYNFRDMMEIYDVSEAIARRMIREIRNIYEGGHPLPQGKVYVTDLELYENLMKKRKVKQWLVSES